MVPFFPTISVFFFFLVTTIQSSTAQAVRSITSNGCRSGGTFLFVGQLTSLRSIIRGTSPHTLRGVDVAGACCDVC